MVGRGRYLESNEASVEGEAMPAMGEGKRLNGDGLFSQTKRLGPGVNDNGPTSRENAI